MTSMLNQGMTPEDILNELLGEFQPEISEKVPAEFHCDCSKERVEKVLVSLRREGTDLYDQGGQPIELKCLLQQRLYLYAGGTEGTSEKKPIGGLLSCGTVL